MPSAPLLAKAAPPPSTPPALLGCLRSPPSFAIAEQPSGLRPRLATHRDARDADLDELMQTAPNPPSGAAAATQAAAVPQQLARTALAPLALPPARRRHPRSMPALPALDAAELLPLETYFKRQQRRRQRIGICFAAIVGAAIALGCVYLPGFLRAQHVAHSAPNKLLAAAPVLVPPALTEPTAAASALAPPPSHAPAPSAADPASLGAFPTLELTLPRAPAQAAATAVTSSQPIAPASVQAPAPRPLAPRRAAELML